MRESINKEGLKRNKQTKKQKQIIEECVYLKNNFNMSEVIGDLNNEISTDEIIEAISRFTVFTF
jgi:uncharacterized alpha/beta hydrolase family protein